MVGVPRVIAGGVSVWAQYTIQTDDHPDGLAAHLRSQEIPTAVYYPVPLHRQGSLMRTTPSPAAFP